MKKLTMALLFTLFVGVSTVWAQCREAGSINFQRGETSATVKGTVSAAKAVCYKFRPRRGQTLTATLTSPGKAVRFSIAPDAFDADEEVTDTTNWQGKLKGDYGDRYIISVHVPKGSDTYTLVISTPSDNQADQSSASVKAGLDAEKVPSGTSPQDFVPSGWKIATRAEGDLNGDGRPDQVIQLVTADTPDSRSDTDAAPERQALLILLGDGGKLNRSGLATKLLIPIVPQYSLELTIKNGVLIVKQDYGMSDVTNLTHRFRFDPPSGRFLLIGRDVFTYTRPLSDDTIKTSENYLTGVRLITTGHFRRGVGTVNETTKREQMTLKKVYFEDVDETSDR